MAAGAAVVAAAAAAVVAGRRAEAFPVVSGELVAFFLSEPHPVRTSATAMANPPAVRRWALRFVVVTAAPWWLVCSYDDSAQLSSSWNAAETSRKTRNRDLASAKPPDTAPQGHGLA